MTLQPTITDTADRRTADDAPLRVALVLPGLHRVQRGAETAFESIGRELARLPGFDVTLIGSGAVRAGEPYRYRRVRCLPRECFERFPRAPLFRSECGYEELSFMPGLLAVYRPRDYDVTVTCSYPYTNWALRRAAGRRPAHVFVTQNGDWPCRDRRREFRLFHCDGLVCTNPEYHAHNRDRWFAALIPNGVDPQRFTPATDGGPGERAAFGLPSDRPVALMVSALIRSKRVLEGVQAVARVPGLHLAVAGDGPQRELIERTAFAAMPGRFHRFNLPRERMPDLYRCADVFLHMSRDEPSANAYIEALASGLPIVTHDRAVTRWTLEDQAVYVDAGDALAVANALRRALRQREPAEVEARRALVQRRFTWSTIARDYAGFFREVCQRRMTLK
ncbi:MAG: glycosyltransferase family 4 protein [Phycisphaeraceae bacterium]